MKPLLKISIQVLFMLIFTSLHAQNNNVKDITGRWAFSDPPREIEIYSENNKYYGKIIKVSGKNDKEKLGQIILKDFVYNQSEKKYTGTVNSPKGMNASGVLIFMDSKRLKINVRKFIFRKSYILKRII